MPGLNARFRAGLGESLQPPVLVALNHAYSV
jgi:hypothetical protein